MGRSSGHAKIAGDDGLGRRGANLAAVKTAKTSPQKCPQKHNSNRARDLS
jgi:hypothetical protein